tara:strand:- start:279 stop:740 length:462 start_codon:yes stop_codon:yes gene_type:complete
MKQQLKNKIKHALECWKYEGLEFTEEMIPKDAVGFVYEMSTVINGKFVKYIGKKNFYSNVKTKLRKKDMPTDKRKKTYKRVKRYNYQKYFSSNEVLKQAKKDGYPIKREILCICNSKLQLSYMEARQQFLCDVLVKDEYLNGNILGKFYKGKI